MASRPERLQKSNLSLYSQIFTSSSVIAITLSLLGLIGIDIWLAWTHWLLVAALFASFSIVPKKVI